MEHFSTNLQAISNELNLKNHYNDSEVLIKIIILDSLELLGSSWMFTELCKAL